MAELLLTGRSLTVATLAEAARGGVMVRLAPEGLERMRGSRALVDEVIAKGIAVYGVTTGLGARATEALDAETLAAFSGRTLRGRAHAVGDKAPDAAVRACLIVRLNSFLSGHSGARPEVATHLADVLNAGCVPVTGAIGSIGGGDLVLNATIGQALVGEGEMKGPDGAVGTAAEVLRRVGIAPLELAPREGLALANHAGFFAGAAAVALVAASQAFEAAQSAATLSMEGFRANLTPLDPRALAVKPLPGQQIAAEGLRARLQGSALWQKGAARRLQDPLSLRNVAQIHGGVAGALTQAGAVVEIEINGASDNPIAVVDSGEMISCGAYFTTELGLAVEAVSRAWVHLAMAQVARISKMLAPAFSGLPLFLAQPDSGSNAFAPVLKVVEDLAVEIARAAQPGQVWPSINAAGAEDCMSSAPAAVRGLEQIADLALRLTAVELMVAAQAVELRGCDGDLGPEMAAAYIAVREISPKIDADRPLGGEIDALADSLREGRFWLGC